jgi:cephalosporin hydroxylase
VTLPYRVQYETRKHTPSDIWEHLPRMFTAACSYPEPKIIELGVRTGNSTCCWLAAIEEQDGGHLWSVDADPPQVPRSWLAEERWTVLTADDRDPAVAGVIAEGTHPGADILFIDTSHEYEHTLAELALYVRMVRPGGTVLLHDTEWGTRDVAAALDKWCPEHGLTWTNHPGCNGMGEIRIPEAA